MAPIEVKLISGDIASEFEKNSGERYAGLGWATFLNREGWWLVWRIAENDVQIRSIPLSEAGEEFHIAKDEPEKALAYACGYAQGNNIT